MKMCRELGLGVCVVLLVAAMAGVAVAGSKVPLERVPAPAVKTVKDRFPKAEIRLVEREGGNRFEFAMTEDRREFDVTVTADGKVLLIKEAISEDAVPAAVKENLQKKFPGAKIIEAEKLIRGDDGSGKVTYELVIRTDRGNRDVRFDADKFLGDAVGDTD